MTVALAIIREKRVTKVYIEKAAICCRDDKVNYNLIQYLI